MSTPTIDERAAEINGAVGWLVTTMLEIGHPMRVEILAQVGDGQDSGGASPVVTARRLRDDQGLILKGKAATSTKLGVVAYHYRSLHQAKLVRIQRTRQVRGATEHIYVLTARGRRALDRVLAGP